MVGGGERKFDKQPRRNGWVALDLALRVGNMETTVPQLYRSLSSPSTIGSIPDPAQRAVKTHDSERGPRARKAGHQPSEVLP